MSNVIRLRVEEDQPVRFGASEYIDVVKPPDYEGMYEVTPSAEEQELPTQNRTMLANIIVRPIPQNYGLITWTGSVLTVS